MSKVSALNNRETCRSRGSVISSSESRCTATCWSLKYPGTKGFSNVGDTSRRKAAPNLLFRDSIICEFLLVAYRTHFRIDRPHQIRTASPAAENPFRSLDHLEGRRIVCPAHC